MRESCEILRKGTHDIVVPVLHQTCRAVRDDKVIILDTFEDDLGERRAPDGESCSKLTGVSSEGIAYITVGVRARLATGSIELVDEGLPLWVRRGELILEYVAIGQMPVGAAHALCRDQARQHSEMKHAHIRAVVRAVPVCALPCEARPRRVRAPCGVARRRSV